MTNDRFEAFLQDAAGDYNPPPETPREEMWTAIEASRRDTPVRVIARRSWTRLAIGVAAALAVGVGIGRLSVGDGVTAPGVGRTVAAPVARTVADVSHRLATAQHLDQVGTFLMAFRMDAQTAGPPITAGPAARDLLLTTRLFLDSKGMADPQLRDLLEDIELVLAQIAQLRSGNDDAELDFIEDGIERRSVLLRLDAATTELGLQAAQGRYRNHVVWCQVCVSDTREGAD